MLGSEDWMKCVEKNKYIISLSNSLIKTTILKNKIKLKDTNIYIQEYPSRDIYNLFYITRKLKIENKISKIGYTIVIYLF